MERWPLLSSLNKELLSQMGQAGRWSIGSYSSLFSLQKKERC